jgi:peptidyl-prolyl cis-trans isomerase C
MNPRQALINPASAQPRSRIRARGRLRGRRRRGFGERGSVVSIAPSDRRDKRRLGARLRAVPLRSRRESASPASLTPAAAQAVVARLAPRDLRLFRLKRAPFRVVQQFPRLVVFLLAAAVAGCGGDDTAHPLVESDDVVLVEVGGEPITLDMLEHLMTLRDVGEDDVEQMRELLDELIKLQAVANRAAEEGVSERPEVRAERMIKDIETQYVRYLEVFQRANPVTEAEIEAAYREQAERAGGRRYRLETIEFERQEAALAELEALRSGESGFEAAIQRAGEAGRTVRRTDWIDGSQVPPDFRTELARAEAGAVMQTLLPFQGNWMVVRLADVEPFEPPPLAELRDGIRRTLLRERTEAMIERTFEAAEITPMLPLEDAGDRADP